ncbi:hypothetical protein DN540_43805, partial [Burkholderia multivorans]
IADRERCLEAGFRHHLVKPVDPAALHRAIDDSDPVHAPHTVRSSTRPLQALTAPAVRRLAAAAERATRPARAPRM